MITKPLIFDSSDGQMLRINMISPWLKKYFNSKKIVKLSLDGGFTCPNRDGTKGTGGCLFCSEKGSGDMASSVTDISSAIDSQIKLLSNKWPADKYDPKYIAYFQNHTNTYAPAEILHEKFSSALRRKDIVGLAIATRPDCLPDDVIDLLSELNRETFLWIELGLQTIHDSTAAAMNLCHCLSDYDNAVKRLSAHNIRIVTHLILGLPGETREMMLESVRYVCQRPVFGMKLHMLNIVRGSGMETSFSGYVPFETMSDYTDILIDALEIIPPEITIHRISGDAPRDILISPAWSYKKRTILNEIHRKMSKRNTWQGRLASSPGDTNKK